MKIVVYKTTYIHNYKILGLHIHILKTDRERDRESMSENKEIWIKCIQHICGSNDGLKGNILSSLQFY